MWINKPDDEKPLRCEEKEKATFTNYVVGNSLFFYRYTFTKTEH